MAATDDPINLIAVVGHADAELLPSFLQHYRKLGVSGFVLAFHGDWDTAALDRLDQEHDVHIWDVLDGDYSDVRRLQILNGMAESFRDRWILHADTDEFLELPCRTLRRTIQALEVMGVDCLPALMLQRQTRDGSLPDLDPHRDPLDQFPCYNLNLCEDMGLEWPTWKAKFPLMRVTANFSMRRGNHLPPNGSSVDHAPIRAVVHHLKWRAALHVAMSLPRGPGSNSHEMQVYQAWLNDHDGKLPTAGARLCSRGDLIARGLLVAPCSQRLGKAALYRKVAAARAVLPASQSRARRQLQRQPRAFGKPAGSSRTQTLIDPENLLLRPGRVCLLTFELAPPQSGGIATAMAVLAERLSAAGHEVDVLLCPFSGPAVLWEGWYEYWAARGVRLHYLPRRPLPDGAYQDQQSFCLTIADTVLHLDPDLVHCVDATGYGAFIALLRAAGLGFSRTRLMVTAHGSTVWHNRGNHVPWYVDEAEHGFCHDIMMTLADVICFPSDYMRGVVAGADLPVRTAVVVPNGMAGATRSFRTPSTRTQSIPKPADETRRPVDELVLFGRLEPRKGYLRFERAIDALLERGFRDFKVTLLGRIGGQGEAGPINRLLNDERIKGRHIANFNHVDAVNYLKSRDCLAVVASTRDNLPYTVYECLENDIPLVASAVGGIPELVHPDDRERILIADDQDALVEALAAALTEGARPARLAFDPDLADIELLAIHGKLVDEARHAKAERDPTTSTDQRSNDVEALVYGDLRASRAPKLLERLTAVAEHGDVKKLHLPSRLCDKRLDIEKQQKIAWIESTEREGWLAGIERAVASSDADYLLFCHAAVLPDASVVQAMARLMRQGSFDAVVAGYRVALLDRQEIVTGPLLAPGGPADFAPAWNLFGAGLFLIAKDMFTSVRGFARDETSSQFADLFAHWELLNRVIAKGGRVAGIPRALSTLYIDHPEQLAASMDDCLAEALIRPWIDAVPPAAEGLIRKAAVVDFGGCPITGTVAKQLRDQLSAREPADGDAENPGDEPAAISLG
ncbi:MAG: glycosyltransferase [Geminicoccaceae bacterium]